MAQPASAWSGFTVNSPISAEIAEALASMLGDTPTAFDRAAFAATTALLGLLAPAARCGSGARATTAPAGGTRATSRRPARCAANACHFDRRRPRADGARGGRRRRRRRAARTPRAARRARAPRASSRRAGARLALAAPPAAAIDAGARARGRGARRAARGRAPDAPRSAVRRD